MFSVSSGDTQLYPSPLLAGLRINVGFDIILTWLATWQAVKAWSPVIITYQFSPKRCWSISFYCLSTKRITKPGQRLVTSNHHLSKMFSIHSSQRPVSSEINSFAIKKRVLLFMQEKLIQMSHLPSHVKILSTQIKQWLNLILWDN